MYTQTITVKIDKRTNKSLDLLAKEFNKGKSEIVRSAIDSFVKSKSDSGAETLLKIAREAKKYQYEAPDDFVENMNKYLYGKKS